MLSDLCTKTSGNNGGADDGGGAAVIKKVPSSPNAAVATASSLLPISDRQNGGGIDQFKKLMYETQLTRRHIVQLLLAGQLPDDECVGRLRDTYTLLRDWTESQQQHNDEEEEDEGCFFANSFSPSSGALYHLTISQFGENGGGGKESKLSAVQQQSDADEQRLFHVNVKDEVHGLQAVAASVPKPSSPPSPLRMSSSNENSQQKIATALGKDEKEREDTKRWVLDCVCRTGLTAILAPYHPVSVRQFHAELDECKRFLSRFTESAHSEGRKPILITDWDGTMKDYCTQYATNLQPVYSAISLANFACQYTRLSAVLTAGPLRGPGILDLTALPTDGPVIFSGSWGREWWIGGKRRVHSDGLTDEGIDALNRLSEEMATFLTTNREFSHFGLVGSGVQRKVDRITLGVQTVMKDISPDLSNRYQREVEERVHRVDPNQKILHLDASQDLEVEVVAHSEGIVWNKANGVKRVVETIGDTLLPPGRVLICGDTHSDLPMLMQARGENPDGVMACFVTSDEALRERVREVLPDSERHCFVSCPDVIHAAIMELIQTELFPASLPSSSSPPAVASSAAHAETQQQNLR